MSFHLKYRPENLEEIIGHKEIVKSIESMFCDENRPHAFLFSGASGCGKTTFARIIADTLRAEIVEINIANTGGVDFVREMDEKARYSPLMGETKVFILDEVQQLTKEGQNCLLKLLEDSPKHSYFILCTTDPNKLLLAIRNRCTSYTLKSLSDNEIKQLIQKVAKEEKIDFSNDILDLIIYKSNGIPRSALVYLNQVKNIKSFDEATKLLADEITEEENCIDILKGIIYKNKNWAELMKIFNNVKTENETIRITFANYLSGCLKNAKNNKDLERFSQLLSLFLQPLTYGSGRAELIYLLAKAFSL